MPGPLKSNERATETKQEWVDKLSASDAEAARAILEANKGKNFVQRILNASDWPTVENPGGGYSSHRMGSAEVEGKNIAFPTLVYDKSTNALTVPADPVREAMRTGEYIGFGSPEEAEKFASGAYKVGLDTGLMQKMLRPEIVNKMWR